MSQKTRFRLFFLIMALFILGANFAHPVTPTLINDLGLHDYMFGVAFAAMMTTNFLFSPLWGKLNDMVKTRYLLLIGCVGYGASQMGFAVAATELGIVLARLGAGVFTGAIFVSFLTYIVSESDARERSDYLTINATVQSVVSAFGYLIGGLLGSISVFLVFFIQTIVLVISGILFFLVCKEENKNGDKKPVGLRQLAAESNPFKALMAYKTFMTFSFAGIFIICIFMYIGQTAFDQAFNYFLKAQLHLGSSYNGMIKAIVGIISFVSNITLCFYIIRKKRSRNAMIVLSGICALLCGVLIFGLPIHIFILLSILVYSANAVTIPLLQDIIAKKSSRDKENVIMGFYNAAKSLGSIAGSMIAGVIYAWNAHSPFAFAAIFFLLTFLLAFQFLYKKVLSN